MIFSFYATGRTFVVLWGVRVSWSENMLLHHSDIPCIAPTWNLCWKDFCIDTSVWNVVNQTLVHALPNPVVQTCQLASGIWSVVSYAVIFVCAAESEPRRRSELDGLSCRSEIIGTYGALAVLAVLFPSLSVPYLFIAVIDQVSLPGCHTSAVALRRRTKKSGNSRA